MLINLGHVNVWDYPYSFFKVACEQAVEFYKQQTMAMSAAIGLTFSGDKKAWDEFFRDK